MTVLLVLLSFFISEGYLAVIDPTEPPKRKSVIMGVAAVVVALIAAFVARWLFKRFLKFERFNDISCVEGDVYFWSVREII